MNKQKKRLRRNWDPVHRCRLRPTRVPPETVDDIPYERLRQMYPRYDLVGFVSYTNPQRLIPVWKKESN